MIGPFFGHHGDMIKMRGIAVATAVLLGLGACGGDPPAPTNEAAEAESLEQTRPEQTEGAAAGKSTDDSSKAQGKTKGGAAAAGAKNEPATTEGNEDDASSAWYPARGLYTYEQSGFEEFCDASSCDKQDLPATQEVKTTYKSQSPDEVVVVTEAEASRSRFVRTTTRHERKGAFITDVFVRFDYEGVNFNNSYQPKPPVETLRLPLSAGMRWSGQWKDSTSGDYSIAVRGKEEVSVGGRSVQAFRLDTVTHFRGDFDGTATVMVWIDPATVAVVKTRGELDVESVFGSYRSKFSATLSSAPDYR